MKFKDIQEFLFKFNAEQLKKRPEDQHNELVLCEVYLTDTEGLDLEVLDSWAINRLDHDVKELKEELEILDKDLLNKIKLNNPILFKEWEVYRGSKINNGVDLSQNFLSWCRYIKKSENTINEAKEILINELKGGKLKQWKQTHNKKAR